MSETITVVYQPAATVVSPPPTVTIVEGGPGDTAAAVAAETARAVAAEATKLSYLAGIVAGGAADNAPIVNALANDSGRRYLQAGKIGMFGCGRLAKNSELFGAASNFSSNATGTFVPNGLWFNPATLISAQLPATVVADGTTWTVTVGAGHPFQPGHVLVGSAMTSAGEDVAGFNVSMLVASTTATTVAVVTTEVPTLNGNPVTTAAGVVKYGHNATVAVDPVTGDWVFSVFAGHGLAADDSFTGSGFAYAEFNRACLIKSVTATTLVCDPPAPPFVTGHSDGGSWGFVHVHLFRLADMDGGTSLGSDTRLETLSVECSNIPGSIGVYASTIQEMGGLHEVTVHNAMYRGIVIDSSDPLNLQAQTAATSSSRALNYHVREIRTIGSASSDPTYSGIEILGSNTTIRGIGDITCVGGGTGINRPDSQIRLDACRAAFYPHIHCERGAKGVLVGATNPCAALVFAGLTGNADLDEVIHIAVPSAGGTNAQLTVMGVAPNGSPTSIRDDQNGVSRTGIDGAYTTDLNGLVSRDSSIDGVIDANLNGDVVVTTSLATLGDLTKTWPVGRYVITVNLTVVPGSTATAVEMEVVQGSATVALAGARSATFPVTTTLQPVSVSVTFRANVTQAGTLLVKVQAVGPTATATVKQRTPALNFAAASGLVGFKAP